MRTFAFVDASNLFYGFDKEYGWKIDYQRLKEYLELKYGISKVLYFGGIDTTIGIWPNKEFLHDYSGDETVELGRYIEHFTNLLAKHSGLSESQRSLAERFIRQAKFYRKIETFGYQLFLKPVKRFEQAVDGRSRGKANCDVDLTIAALTTIDSYDRALILSGDGDFLPLYKHLEERGKLVYVIARAARTAGEVRRHLGSRFVEIRKLRKQIELVEKQKNGSYETARPGVVG